MVTVTDPRDPGATSWPVRDEPEGPQRERDGSRRVTAAGTDAAVG